MKRKAVFKQALATAEEIIVITADEAKATLKNLAAQIMPAHLNYSGWYACTAIGNDDSKTQTLRVAPECTNIDAVKADQRLYWKMSAVKLAQDVQKENPFGSTPHRNAALLLRRLAEYYGVEEHFDSIEDYDEDVAHMAEVRSWAN